MNVPATLVAPCVVIFGIDGGATAGAGAGTLAGFGAPCLLVKSFDTESILLTS